MDSSVQAVRLREEEADALRAAGHAIPKVTSLERKSDLTLEQRVYVIKRLFTLRNMLLPFMMRVFPDQDPMDMIRDVLRSQYNEDNDVDIPLPKSIVDMMEDPKGYTNRFMPFTYGVYDGRAVDGEFHSLFMMITNELTSTEFMKALVENAELEIKAGAEVAADAWKSDVAPRLEEGGDLYKAGAAAADQIRIFERNLVEEAKAMDEKRRRSSET